MAKLKTLTDTQYDELRTIARSYDMSLGGYQNSHGVVLYTSARVVYGKTYGELVTDLHAAGRDNKKRIARTIARKSLSNE